MDQDLERVDLIMTIYNQCNLEELRMIKRMVDQRNAQPKVERKKAIKINQSINDSEQ